MVARKNKIFGNKKSIQTIRMLLKNIKLLSNNSLYFLILILKKER